MTENPQMPVCSLLYIFYFFMVSDLKELVDESSLVICVPASHLPVKTVKKCLFSSTSGQLGADVDKS